MEHIRIKKARKSLIYMLLEDFGKPAGGENVARQWRGLRRLPCPRLWWLKKDYDHAASYGYSLEYEAKDV